VVSTRWREARRFLQVAMPHQYLNRAEAGAGFEQMSGKAGHREFLLCETN